MDLPTDDRRSPLAKARDEFLQSDQGKQLCDPTTLRAPAEVRQYLTNRIEKAFLAGIAAARGIPRKYR